MMTREEFEALNRLQAEINRGLEAMKGEPGKSYEGALELHLAGKFEEYYTVILHCYLIGPGRHYAWKGKSLEAVLGAAAVTVSKWVDEQAADGEAPAFEPNFEGVEFGNFSMVRSTTYKNGVPQ